jgi:hypothetical protein
MTKLKDLVPIFIPTDQDTRAIGKKICNTDLAKKFGQTVRNMTANILTGKNMAEGFMNGLTGVATTVIGLKTRLRDTGPTLGSMDESILAIGKTIISMVMAFTHGLTEESTKASMNLIKSMGMEFTNGVMAEDMKVNGSKASNMVLESIFYLMATLEKEFGKMESVNNG